MTTDAASLTRALGGRWWRRYGVAPCPICQPERRRAQTALTLGQGNDGRLLLHCKKGGCAFRDLLGALGVSGEEFAPPDPAVAARRRAEERDAARRREAQALALWRGAQPIAGTPAEAYLSGRGITCPLPPSLRYHAGAWHPSGRRLPAMVARVEGAGAFLQEPRAREPAIHRTFLAPDGRGKAAVDPPKAMLGACAGGAVRLAEPPEGKHAPLVVAEGIETALSLASGLLSGPARVWAALSTSGLRGLALPPAPGRLIVAADGDAPGRTAAHALAERAHALGWRVELLPAPEGQDWNDVLRAAVQEVAP